MPTLKQEYKKFMNENFKGLQLKTPLFYNWTIGLRFNLQMGETDANEYFTEVIKRATTLFQSVFSSSDKLFFVLIEYKYKRRKIRFINYPFKQIKGLNKSEISYAKINQLYEPKDKLDIRNIALLKLDVDRINFKNILSAIGHTDFYPRQPRLDDMKGITSKEIYFINLDKKIIFHMYDDRGLDIIATDKQTLNPFYKTYNNWILNSNREQIDKQFE